MAKSQLFLSRHTGALRAYAVDARQVALFGPDDQQAKSINLVK